MSDALVNGLSGASGGIIAQLITYPLQAVNTRQQTVRKSKSNLQSDVDLRRKSAEAHGTLKAMLDLLTKEGVSGLYRGLPPSLLGTAVSQGIYYYFYQLFQDMARKKSALKNGELSTATNLIVAAMAGAVNVIITNPIWITVTRMQTQTQKVGRLTASLQKSVGTFGTIQEIYSDDGIRGFWKGVLPNLVMVCNPAIQFAIYEGLLARVTRNRPKRRGLPSVSGLEVFLMGAIAKLGATLATYPLQVVKARIQASQDIAQDASSRYTGTLDAILKMLRQEGVKGFYGGLSTKVTQSVLAASILFLMRDKLVKMAKALVEEREGLKTALVLGHG